MRSVANTSPSWQPRVSRGLAGRASLHPYRDATYYDYSYRRRRVDVKYYLAACKCLGGPVLEYGVGTGRTALPIAKAGLEVTGVDLSPEMLSAFRERLKRESAATRSRVRLVKGDMRRVRLGRRFALVIAPFNAILHLYSQRDLESFFARVRAHLSTKGRFVFDFLIPRAGDLGRDPDHAYVLRPFVHPTLGRRVTGRERFSYDVDQQILTVESEYSALSGTSCWTVPMMQRQFFPCEMEALLSYCGFDDIQMTEDFSKRLPSPGVDSLVVNCRAARRGSKVARA